MTPEKERLQQKIALRHQVIIKNGTYTYGAKPQEETSPASEEDVSSPEVNEATDDKVAEIMQMFSSNIQNNVSSLFDNIQ